MADNKGIVGHPIKMVALGREFKLGCLYDYRTDHILSDELQHFESSVVADDKHELHFLCPNSTTSKWEQMGLSKHLQISVMAGLIDEFTGSSNYIKERPVSFQVTRTFVCYATARTKHLNLHPRVNQDILRYLSEHADKLAEATHFVKGIIYGDKVFCVLIKELDSDDPDQEAKLDAEEKLTKLVMKMEIALEDRQDHVEFKAQFTNKKDKEQLTRVKCRLYSNLHQSQAVRECSFFDAYKECFKFVSKLHDPNVNSSKAIPMVVFLCPLKVIDPFEKCKWIRAYRDVGADLVDRCTRIWTTLETVIGRADFIRITANKANCMPLRQFSAVVAKYQELLKTTLKNVVSKAREKDGKDGEMERIINVAESHPLFESSRLDQWLQEKQAESDMAVKWASMDDFLTFLASKTQLGKELANLSEGNEFKYSLVLFVPSLEEHSNNILKAMTDYVENPTAWVETENVLGGQAWHTAANKRKDVLDTIKGFSDYIKSNNRKTKRLVKFFIVPSDCGEELSCSYSIYEGENVVKSKMYRLLPPPTGLKLFKLEPIICLKKPKLSSASILVEWDYENVGFPYWFIVEYRYRGKKGGWKSQKVENPRQNRTTICFKPKSVIYVRVAAASFIGHGSFSEALLSSSALDRETPAEIEKPETPIAHHDPLLTPEQNSGSGAEPNDAMEVDEVTNGHLYAATTLDVFSVTETSAELAWLPIDAEKFHYCVRYWQSENIATTQELPVGPSASSCRLEQLQPDTSYSVYVVAVSPDKHAISLPSEIILFKTPKTLRFVEWILKLCKKIGNQNGMDLYSVPLHKSSGPNSSFDRFIFRPVGQQYGRSHKTIFLLGESGTGKTAVINRIVNYVFNVESTDPFRFQLVQEQVICKSLVSNQTDRVTVYDIHHFDGFRVPFSLTIVDTPGFGQTNGLEKDEQIIKMVGDLFDDPDGIQELNIICLVSKVVSLRPMPLQNYILDTAFSIFGSDVRDNINFFLTFVNSDPPDARLPDNFYNCGFFRWNSEPDGDVIDPADRFFSLLTAKETKSLALTRQVLQERRRLDSTVRELQSLVKATQAKMEEIKKTKHTIANCRAEMEASNHAEEEIPMPRQVETPVGIYVQNCNKCQCTCYDLLSRENQSTVNPLFCPKCPGKCSWNEHSVQQFRWESGHLDGSPTLKSRKRKYEIAEYKKLLAQDQLKDLQKDVKTNEETAHDHADIISRSIRKLNEISLHPVFPTPEVIDQIIEAEQQEQRPGFLERIEGFQRVRQLAKIRNRPYTALTDEC